MLRNCCCVPKTGPWIILSNESAVKTKQSAHFRISLLRMRRSTAKLRRCQLPGAMLWTSNNKADIARPWGELCFYMRWGKYSKKILSQPQPCLHDSPEGFVKGEKAGSSTKKWIRRVCLLEIHLAWKLARLRQVDKKSSLCLNVLVLTMHPGPLSSEASVLRGPDVCKRRSDVVY